MRKQRRRERKAERALKEEIKAKTAAMSKEHTEKEKILSEQVQRTRARTYQHYSGSHDNDRRSVWLRFKHAMRRL